MTAPDLPLTEFDPTVPAFIEPSAVVTPREVPNACVVTFFADLVDQLIAEGARILSRNRWEDGPHPLVEITRHGRPLAVLQAGVGAPLAAGLLEQTIALGCRAFIVCGGVGSLVPELTVGHLVVLDSALRDEGTSFHYAPPSRVIDADPDAVAVLAGTLARHGIPFVTARAWTTDAPYRETPARIASRRAEGCVVVDMEASALAAVARFRRMPLAQVVYAGDDLSGETWDHRSWQSRAEVRRNVFELAAEAALTLAERA